MAPTKVRVALDWTPNTIHSGLFLALAHRFYDDINLSVELLSPDVTYETTPAKRLAAGEVDLIVCPSETIIAYNESDARNPMLLQAVYAILQRDASAIVTCSDKFKNLKELESGTYGSYNARYEDGIVRDMVSSAGGKGENITIRSEVEKLSLFDAVKKGHLDATWVFTPWEGVEAEMEGVKLNIFRAGDFKIPYGYSPVIARRNDGGLEDDIIKRFVKATRRGYELAQHDPKAAVEVLRDQASPKRSDEFLLKSQIAINEFYGDKATTLGHMDSSKWWKWLEWLGEKGLLQETHLQAGKLFTNI
ncbi:hypothetical protein BLS_005853 [Venturia inaequalis]|uniref:4-amino-5-hydroxymethyl-2-methylpyrimidine phosphate synthase n=1 Tax=Venturia inaequalis TaxID=5025 RepID=A0A8H3UUG6_VENIN|nr:hypothetical protein BLS_005853 [Venturia inaequalis]KAE9975960.1 hypothetical protein EG328_002886 [Venturia inaequalis]KAE9990252.1 hypothetical protein EG327_001635 [Venturia inaequalis]RDI77960.1 hypothetical protein Vi05172_g12039 [Venturia inaequalis]